MRLLLQRLRLQLNHTQHSIKKLSRIAFSPKYLLFTNVCISLSLSSVGDTLEQHYEILMGDLEKYSGKRTQHMALSGIHSSNPFIYSIKNNVVIL